MMAEPSKQPADEYVLPDIDYLPARPQSDRPNIGMIGCGGITDRHLSAYRSAGYPVVALTDVDQRRAIERRDEFFPNASVYRNSEDLLKRADVEIVDVATHPQERENLIEAALLAGKHVLSQKPFVTDLAAGRRLCKLAISQGCQLAVNQNGRWAPWVSWMRKAIEHGLIGQIAAVDTLLAWDHTWVQGTPFERIPHLILYDFAIHWFDMLHCYTRGQQAKQVTAWVMRAPDQQVDPPLLAQVMVELESCQATMAFRGASPWGQTNRTHITGTHGTLRCEGEGMDQLNVVLSTERGEFSPQLEGDWFPGGFDGTMSELIVAIEQGREPIHSAVDNLKVLEVCFAAIQSAETGQAVRVGEVQSIKPEWIESVPR